LGGLWFKASPGKKLAKLHLNKQAECGSMHLSDVGKRVAIKASLGKKHKILPEK
jgi:hypothetical protein